MSDELEKPSLLLPFTPIDQLIFESRTIFLTGAVDAMMAQNVCRQLMAMESQNPNLPITLWINSNGGEVYSGFAIYDLAQTIRPKVITVVAGMAASMGSLLALAAEKEDRYITANGKILIHQPLIGGVLQGRASDIEIHAKDIIALKKKIHRLYADRTGTPVEKYEELMERDRWIDPAEAIELGLVSGIWKKERESQTTLP